MDRIKQSFAEFVEIMARLRAPGGCPWDREQDHHSLKPYVIEETYEVIEAIDEGDMDALCEELGDLLLQVVFHAQIAREAGTFDIADVCEGISKKLIGRHPHVFGEEKVSGSGEVLVNWEKIKQMEKGKESVLDGVPSAMPQLVRTQRLSERAGRVGFDWPDVTGVLDKIDEELAELREAISGGDEKEMHHETGDLLFAVANLARHLGQDAEDCLKGANGRFEKRFRHLEAKVKADKHDINSKSLDELENLWQEAKKSVG